MAEVEYLRSDGFTTITPGSRPISEVGAKSSVG